MKKNIFIIIVFIITALLCMGAASASNISNTQVTKTINTTKDDSNYNKTPNTIYSSGLYSTKNNSVNNITINKTVNTPTKNISNKNTTSNIINNGCCSVLVHVNSTYDVYAFRRDSSYTADLNIQPKSWYGRDTIMEYKTYNGYFIHTIITVDGWIVGIGGNLNKDLVDLAGKTILSGQITQTTLNNAYNILRTESEGHFMIMAPNDYVGLVIYGNNTTKQALFKMNNGQYVCVPNNPNYYKSGYTSTTDPVGFAINLETTLEWGKNRRNIISYQIMNTINSTQINIWASTYGTNPDNIIFQGQTIIKSTIPLAPNKMYVGQVNLTDPFPPTVISTIPANDATNIARNTNISITFNEPVKWGNNYIEVKANGVASPTSAYTMNLSDDRKTLTIDPTTLWAANAKYTIILHTRCVTDFAGNKLALITIKFITGTK